MRAKLQLLALLIGLVGFTNQAMAQEEKKEEPKYGWTKEAAAGLNLSQVMFDNWAQGGDNSTAWQTFLNLRFIMDQPKTNWRTTGKFRYGQSKLGDSDFKKSDDEIHIESIFQYKPGKNWNPYASVIALSQFAPAYDGDNVKISDFLDPGYFTEAVGISYEPSKSFRSRVGAAAKQTVTRNFPRYSDDPETPDIEKLRNEIGAEWVTGVEKKITSSTIIGSKLELFSNLKGFDQIDVNWDNLITAEISKLFNFNFAFRLFYDRDISKKRQIKESFAIGLAYTFF